MSFRRTVAAAAAACALLSVGAAPAHADLAGDINAGLVKTRVEGAKNLPCAALQTGNLSHKFTYYSDAVKDIKKQAKGTSLTASETSKLATAYADRLLECGVVKADLASGSSQIFGGSSDLLTSLTGALGSS